MTWLDRDKRAVTGGTNLVVRYQLTLNRSAIVSCFDHARDESYRLVGRRRTQQFDCILSRHGAGWFVSAALFHQMPCGGPVAMTIEQSADDAAAQNTGERFVFRFGLPLGDNLFTFSKTANVQTFRICGSTAETGKVRSVSFLD